MPKTIIVIPCYNEAKRLDTNAFITFANLHPDIHFLFSNDGSTDDTPEIIVKLCALNAEAFSLYSLQLNRGKAEAVREGLLHALNETPEYIGFWDADLATPLETILEFILLMESQLHLQMVVGSRVKLLGRTVERNGVRHYLGRIGATLASIVLDLGVYDTQCGAKLFRVSPETTAVFATPFLARWVFDIEIFARLIIRRRERGEPPAETVIYELPLKVWKDVRGSKVKSQDFLTAFWELLRIRRHYFTR
ncbi:MAG: glycosyltransferase [Rhizobacter sp.]|nr:glycosyltransferase [Chlorobiales bacterium]